MNEAANTEGPARSYSKRCWEAIRLSEGGGLCYSLDLGMGGEDGARTPAGAFLFEEVDSCYKHEEKAGLPTHPSLPGTLPK